MYFITTKRMLEVCFSAHPNIQYRAFFSKKSSDTSKCFEVAEFFMWSQCKGSLSV